MPAATTIQEKIEFQEDRIDTIHGEIGRILKHPEYPERSGLQDHLRYLTTQLKKARKALKRRQTLLKNSTY